MLKKLMIGLWCSSAGCMVALACSNSGQSGDQPAPAIDDFCRRYVEALAAYVERCGCGAALAESSRAQREAACAPGGYFAPITAAVAAGDLVYDADAAAALLSRLDDPDPLCVEEVFRALKLDSRELYSLAGTFTGTHELGSPCTLPVGYKGGVSDCREGVCARNEAGGGVCIALVGVGEPCDASGDHNFNSTTPRLCFERRLSDSDGEYESAFDSLSCIPTAPGAATRVCAKNLADGEPCHAGEACRSGRCVGTGVPREGLCAAKLMDGVACTSHTECLSGACGNREPRVCGALLADGEFCEARNEACASGSCNDSDGSGSFCGPAPSRKIGEACSSSMECISAGHGDSRDTVCLAGRCVADICASGL